MHRIGARDGHMADIVGAQQQAEARVRERAAAHLADTHPRRRRRPGRLKRASIDILVGAILVDPWAPPPRHVQASHVEDRHSVVF